jgi:hypothetical protein
VTALRVWAGLGLSLALAACSGDDHAPPIAATHPLPECPNANYTTCDVRKAPCQRQLLALAGCVYGVDTTPQVPVRVVSEQQLVEELNRAPSEATDEEQADDAAELPHIERALADLKLLQPGDLTEGGGSTAQIVANIDGVYQDSERGIALVDRGVSKNTAEADALLVHELVHAIQDAQFGLEAWRQQYPTSIDSVLALRTVSEGQATYAQFRAFLALSGRDVAQIDWPSTLVKFRDQLLSQALDDSSPYLASITTFPYAYGARSAHLAWSDHQAQFDTPPRTTLEVLSLDDGVAVAPPEALEMDAPASGGDYGFLDGDTMGAFLLELSSHQLGADESTAHDLALSWRGDALWVYAGPNDETVWLWMLELADTAHAEALAALAPASHSFEATVSGKRVVLIGGDERPDWVVDASSSFLMNAP